MPRSPDFYQQRASQPAAISTAQPVQTTQVVPPPPPGDSGGGINSPQNIAATNRGFLSFFGQGMREIFSGPQPNWDQMSFAQKYGVGSAFGRGAGRMGVDLVTSLPKTIIKAPIGVGYSALEGIDSASQKVFGTKQFVPDKVDLTGIFGNNAVTRYFGDVSGVRATYKEAKGMGSGSKFDTMLAAIQATGKFTGDLAISASLVNSIRGAFKPSLATVEKPVVGTDIRPKVPDQLSQIKTKIADSLKTDESAGITDKIKTAVGKKLGLNPTTTFEQDPNATFMRLPKGAAAQYGGNSGNTFLRISPVGADTAEFSIVQVRPSLVSRLYGKAKIGGDIIQTDAGPAIKVESGIVKYDPGAITAGGDPLPDFLQGSAPAVATTPAIAAPAATGTLSAADQFAADMEAANAPKPAAVAPAVNANFPAAQAQAEAMTGKAPIPGVMSAPLKGFENSPVDPKQLSQINYIAKERGIDDRTLNVMVNAITGKGSVSQLTQTEAYNVAETVRLHNLADPSLPGAGDMIFRPFTQPARYWMESAERELGHPVYSRGYIPVETGFRLADKVLFPQLNNQIVEQFGKYADPKYLPELRLLTSYVEGNSAVITDNPQLTPEAKTELTKIGDFARKWFEQRFAEGNINSERFKGVYAPKLKQLGTIYNLYKQDSLPPDLQPFYTFERAGSDAPMEDNLLVLMQVYAKAFARNKYLKEPLSQAVRVGENLPDNLKKSFNDYLQEKLGYQGKLEMGINRWGAKLSKATDGFLPTDVIRRTINILMNNSYAATLGLPRVMPVMAQFIQSALMNYAEFGDDPKLMISAFRKLGDSKAMEDWKNSGFNVDYGQVYGGGFAEKAAQGVAGKAIDAYQSAQDLTLKPFSKTDVTGRAPMYFAAKQRFNDNWSAFVKGKIDFDQFEKNIKMSGFNPTLQGIIRQKLLENTPESIKFARDQVVQETIDSSFFPYRKGSESRLFYGTQGKMMMQYLSFPFEYAHTIKSYVARGQWDKLIRLYAMSTALQRSVKEATGVDITGYLASGPLKSFSFGPLVKAVWELGSAFNNANQDNAQELDRNYSDVVAALRNYGGSLFGVGSQRLQALYKSVKRMEAGVSVSTDPDPMKRFGIYSSTGKLKQWVTFADLLKYTLGGNPDEFTDLRDRTNTVKRAQMRYDAKKSEAVNALVDGDFKKFDKIITENQIQIGDLSQTLQSYNQPLDQRLFSRMPAPLKAKYIHLFYPQE